jgi:hypothetical protein
MMTLLSVEIGLCVQELISMTRIDPSLINATREFQIKFVVVTVMSMSDNHGNGKNLWTIRD